MLLIALAAIPWAVGVIGFSIALLLVVIADKLIPKATHGNCWSFVGPRWSKHGGYIVVRMADDIRIFGRRVIPHALWLRSWPEGADVQQTEPVTRKRHPLHTIYFRFRVKNTESKH